jgi:hypothetical protein
VASVVVVAGPLVVVVAGPLVGAAVVGGVVVAGALVAGVVVGALVGAAVVEGAAVVVGWSAPGVPALAVSGDGRGGDRPPEQHGDHQGSEQQRRR